MVDSLRALSLSSFLCLNLRTAGLKAQARLKALERGSRKAGRCVFIYNIEKTSERPTTRDQHTAQPANNQGTSTSTKVHGTVQGPEGGPPGRRARDHRECPSFLDSHLFPPYFYPYLCSSSRDVGPSGGEVLRQQGDQAARGRGQRGQATRREAAGRRLKLRRRGGHAGAARGGYHVGVDIML